MYFVPGRSAGWIKAVATRNCGRFHYCRPEALTRLIVVVEVLFFSIRLAEPPAHNRFSRWAVAFRFSMDLRRVRKCQCLEWLDYRRADRGFRCDPEGPPYRDWNELVKFDPRSLDFRVAMGLWLHRAYGPPHQQPVHGLYRFLRRARSCKLRENESRHHVNGVAPSAFPRERAAELTFRRCVMLDHLYYADGSHAFPQSAQAGLGLATAPGEPATTAAAACAPLSRAGGRQRTWFHVLSTAGPA